MIYKFLGWYPLSCVDRYRYIVHRKVSLVWPKRRAKGAIWGCRGRVSVGFYALTVKNITRNYVLEVDFSGHENAARLSKHIPYEAL